MRAGAGALRGAAAGGRASAGTSAGRDGIARAEGAADFERAARVVPPGREAADLRAEPGGCAAAVVFGAAGGRDAVGGDVFRRTDASLVQRHLHRLLVAEAVGLLDRQALDAEVGAQFRGQHADGDGG